MRYLILFLMFCFNSYSMDHDSLMEILDRSKKSFYSAYNGVIMMKLNNSHTRIPLSDSFTHLNGIKSAYEVCIEDLRSHILDVNDYDDLFDYLDDLSHELKFDHSGFLIRFDGNSLDDEWDRGFRYSYALCVSNIKRDIISKNKGELK